MCTYCIFHYYPWLGDIHREQLNSHQNHILSLSGWLIGVPISDFDFLVISIKPASIDPKKYTLLTGKELGDFAAENGTNGAKEEVPTGVTWF